MTEQWAHLMTVYSGLDVDVVRGALELENIPVLVRGEQVGMFGAGFQGPLTRGAELLVPAGALERARAIVAGEGGDLDDSDSDSESDSDSDETDSDE